MDKENKGLADNHDGDFILNESGTSVSNDNGDAINTDAAELSEPAEVTQPDITFTTEDPVASNDIASDEESQLGEDVIKPFDDLFPEHKAYDDMDEISSTDDV